MIDLNKLSLRELQKEAAKAISTLKADNKSLSKFNKLAPHDSQQWYKIVITEYINMYGNLPSVTGPAANITLIYNNV